jgi:AbrB family looped-hinge helix DNA binding protein
VSALAVVQSRGQVTLPKELREAADIRPGDRVLFDKQSDGTIAMTVIRPIPIEEIFARFADVGSIDVERLRAEVEADAAAAILARARCESD